MSGSSRRAKLTGISVGALFVLLGVFPVGSSGIAYAAGTVTPTLTLSSSANPSAAGQSVTFLLTLAGPAGQTVAPSGPVQFAVDGVDLGGPVTPVPLDEPPPVSASSALSPSVSTLSPGTHTITATFAGDSTYAAGTAPGITQTVNAAAGPGTVTPTLTLSSSANPSAAGQSVTFLLTLAGPAGQTVAPSGPVQFAVDGVDLGGPVTPVPLDEPPPVSASSALSPSVSTLSPGTHTITATFAGDSTYAAGTAPGITQTVNAAAGPGTVTPTLTLSSSANPSAAGQSVTFLLTLAGPAGQTVAPSGPVQFAVDGVDLGGPVTPVPLDEPPPVSASSALSPSVSTLSPGTHTITATFAGDSTYAAGTAPGITQTVNMASQSISFTAPATGTAGGSATLTATGGGSGNPVVFSVDPSSGSGVCTVSGTNGATVSYAAAGSCVIDANQAGNASYAAAPPVTGTITVGQASQSISFTAPATGTAGGSATLAATGGGSGNPVVFSVDPSSGSGVCAVSGTNGSTVSYAAAGSCVIDANQAGNASYTAAPPVTATITVNQAPAFVIDSPPLTAVAGQAYDYTFTASGTPAPTYALASGAPSWLSVSASTGEVTGTPPSGTTSFSYAVTATNVAGTATAGPFTITVAKASSNADISVVLSCPVSLTVGDAGTCTLTVANAGPATATKVVAGVLLPAALSETSCTSGCARHANVFTWTLASLASGASAKFAITVKASTAGKVVVLAAAASQNPDPHPLNNISAQQITITR